MGQVASPDSSDVVARLPQESHETIVEVALELGPIRATRLRDGTRDADQSQDPSCA